jgi:hypothetical protein
MFKVPTSRKLLDSLTVKWAGNTEIGLLQRLYGTSGKFFAGCPDFEHALSEEARYLLSNQPASTIEAAIRILLALPWR